MITLVPSRQFVACKTKQSLSNFVPGTLRFKEAEPDHATAFVFQDTEGELWLCYTSVDLEHGISTLRMPGQVPRSVDVPEPKRSPLKKR